MSQNGQTVGVFTMPKESPGGEGSTCCGSVGQTEEEIAELRAALEGLGFDVEVHDVKKPDVIQKHPNVLKLLRTFGMGAVPILAVEDKIVGMAFPSPEEAVKAVKENLVGA